MNRISSTVIFALVPFAFVALVFTSVVRSLPTTKASEATSASALTRLAPSSVQATSPIAVTPVTDPGLVVQAMGVSVPEETKAVHAAEPLAIVGESAPVAVLVSYETESLLPGSTPGVEAQTMGSDQRVGQSIHRLNAIVQGQPTVGDTLVARSGSLSPFDLALASGRLAHFSH